MSKTPLPVPSKVAVTAIRGLIVGTTCSLALITEDRRRRIKHAHSAIHNAERIRSARNYHAGGAALALAIEEEGALYESPHVPSRSYSSSSSSSAGNPWDRFRTLLVATEQEESVVPTRNPEPIAQRQEPDTTKIPRRKEESSVIRIGGDTTTTTTTKTTTTSEQNPPNSRIRSRAKLKLPANRGLLPPPKPFPVRRNSTSVFGAAEQRLKATTTSARSPFAFPTKDEIRTMIEKAADDKDTQLLEQSLNFVVQSLTVQPKGVSLDDSTIDTYALLCRTSLEMENFKGAREVFRLVRRCGPLSETAYYGFEPFKLLDEIIRRMELCAQNGNTIHKLSIAHAVDLYCERFAGEAAAEVKSEHGFAVGKKLIQMVVAAGASALAKIEALFWRCNSHRPGGDLEFTHWYITQLHKAGDHKRAIKFFTLTYAKMSPTFASVEEVGGAVVDSVNKAQGYKASAVLRALDRICRPDDVAAGVLHTTWVMQLLEAQWTWKQDWDEVTALFDELNRPLRDVVAHPDGVWRVMMDLAYKAGRPELAKYYHDDALSCGDVLFGDFLITMFYAGRKAEAGDWDGVFEDVRSLRCHALDEDKGERVSRRLVPILKHYAESHTAAETDALVRRYVLELQVPICRDLVTFTATEYGSIRDSESLLAWLEFCAAKGFRVDAAFSNAILGTCRHSWNFSYRALRNTYLRLKELGEDFTDGYTERMMADAAIKDKSFKQEWRRHLANLQDRPTTPEYGVYSKTARDYSARDIMLMMKSEMLLSRPKNAVAIYRKALTRGVQLPLQGLHLAIKAALEQGGEDGGETTAAALMEQADKAGKDITTCQVRLILAELKKKVDRGSDGYAQHRDVCKILAAAERRGWTVTHVVLNNAANICLNAGIPLKGMSFARRAAEAKGEPPCYDAFNFSVYLHSHLMMTPDVEVVRGVLDRAKGMAYWPDEVCYRTLKHALQTARGKRYAFPQAVGVLEEALEDCVAARKRVRNQGDELREGALEIMRAAAESQEGGMPFEHVLERHRTEAAEEEGKEMACPPLSRRERQRLSDLSMPPPEGQNLVEETMLAARRDVSAVGRVPVAEEGDALGGTGPETPPTRPSMAEDFLAEEDWFDEEVLEQPPLPPRKPTFRFEEGERMTVRRPGREPPAPKQRRAPKTPKEKPEVDAAFEALFLAQRRA